VKSIATAFLGLLAASPLAAQSDYGPLALKLSTSARMLGMGDMGVAGRDDDVVFYNPAQLFVARGTSFSVARLSATARGGTMSTVLRLGPGGIGIGANFLEYQTGVFDLPFRRNDVLPRALMPASSVLGAVGYAQVYKGFRLGAAAKYAADSRSNRADQGVYGDVGIAREVGRFTAALAVQHLGKSVKGVTRTIEAPITTTLGASTARPLGPFDVVATGGVAYSAEDELNGGGGLEVGWSWISGYSIAVRGGAHSARQGGDTELMGGFGFTADRTTFDLGVERLPGNRAGYRAGFRIR
jgi:hypothetical protein